eukprot:11799611-Ditylum_brightwellii.AAC.1
MPPTTQVYDQDQAKKNRCDKWITVQTAYHQQSSIFEEKHQAIAEEQEKFAEQRLEVAQKYGVTNADDSDIIEINVGGKIISATRGTLTQLKGTKLDTLFSGRWDKKLPHDEMG